MRFKVLTINPGSTSTKIALFEDNQCTFSKNIKHAASELERYRSINDQLPFRKHVIQQALADANITMNDIDAFVGRGGLFCSVESGTYEVNDLMLQHAKEGIRGHHPCNLGVQIAAKFGEEYQAKVYTVNPPTVDEYQPLARRTGIKGIYRVSSLHALNTKEMAIRHAETIGKRYIDCNFVVCHAGGGITIAAHKKGKIVDGTNGTGGEGPLAPTRCGAINVVDILDYMEKNNASTTEIRALCEKTGGFVDLLGTSDALDVERKIAEGDEEAAWVWDTMIYQIGKYIGSMATVLSGKVDGILIGGGIAHSKDFIAKVSEMCDWIAPITVYPGEMEMEALAAGAIRVLSGSESPKQYNGIPIW